MGRHPVRLSVGAIEPASLGSALRSSLPLLLLYFCSIMSGPVTGQQTVAVPSGGDDSSKDDGASGQKPNPGSRAKRILIESACAACRRRKSKVCLKRRNTIDLS